jgi:hypothetical protein
MISEFEDFITWLFIGGFMPKTAIPAALPPVFCGMYYGIRPKSPAGSAQIQLEFMAKPSMPTVPRPLSKKYLYRSRGQIKGGKSPSEVWKTPPRKAAGFRLNLIRIRSSVPRWFW